jgi:uncharacterized protein
MQKEALKPFLMKTLNGMTYGLFATLIIGVIIRQIGYLLNIELLYDTIFLRLASLMGAGIGLGIALSLKIDGLKLVVIAMIGGIATSFRVTFTNGLELVANNEPLTVYLVVVSAIILMKYILVRKTPVDILLIPLVGVFLATILTLIISAPMRFIVDYIQLFVEQSTLYAPLIMSIVIAVVMGMLLTSPISSAAIAITINLSGIAGGAAVVGCTTQMIGFAVQSRKDNNIGMVLSIAFGTSMLQFKNILRKPIIWLPTIITSAILGPIFALLIGTKTTREGAGMGSSGLVGQLQTLFAMEYSFTAYISILLMILLPMIMVYFIDLIFRKYTLITEGDLAVGKDIA